MKKFNHKIVAERIEKDVKSFLSLGYGFSFKDVRLEWDATRGNEMVVIIALKLFGEDHVIARRALENIFDNDNEYDVLIDNVYNCITKSLSKIVFMANEIKKYNKGIALDNILAGVKDFENDNFYSFVNVTDGDNFEIE